MSTIAGLTSSSSTSTTATTGTQTLGQDDFLTLLIAQLQNQDPLNPTDATEFTSQLAQYSQLEQLFNLNDAMDELTVTTTKSQNISALNLIGQEVIVEGDELTLAEEPVNLGYKIDGAVTDLTITIQNSAGQTVATLGASDLSEGNHFVSWDGMDAEGNLLASGTYTFALSATGGDTAAITPLVRTKVTGIDLSGSEPQLITDSGTFKLSLIYGAYDSNSG